MRQKIQRGERRAHWRTQRDYALAMFGSVKREVGEPEEERKFVQECWDGKVAKRERVPKEALIWREVKVEDIAVKAQKAREKRRKRDLFAD